MASTMYVSEPQAHAAADKSANRFSSDKQGQEFAQTCHSAIDIKFEGKSGEIPLMVIINLLHMWGEHDAAERLEFELDPRAADKQVR